MGRIKCDSCQDNNAICRRPKTGQMVCKQCFYDAFEEEVHQTIVQNNLFERGEKVAIGASGGKDSTVLAYIMNLLNKRHDYGLNLFLLSIDEGIAGYRDDSLETVKRNEQQYEIPLTILSYRDLYGWTMDEIVKQIGLKNNCTFCGVFRRQALDRGALMLDVDKIVTGHNADDIAETVIMNILRGDVARLRRCTSITTGVEGCIPRSKPFKYTYEKEIVLYAHYKNLDYFSTECIYSPQAFRGWAREYLKDLEVVQSRGIIDIIHAAENLHFNVTTKMPVQGECERCGYMSSRRLCQACVLLDGLNSGSGKEAIKKKNFEANEAIKASSDSGNEQQAEQGSSSRKDNRKKLKKRVVVAYENGSENDEKVVQHTSSSSESESESSSSPAEESTTT
eukprot:TRINITY_DN3684_c0_g1_i1.p1 TRINITY_DN3684_c0_g1~~TRINITY_DN3684_c0_g1_i1.p1  ORF type:complete len:394 (-),score=124.68 TRINITY_DN3684_c0_g1_i1:1555-2736(-)